MAKNENRREVLSAVAIFLLFGVGTGSTLAAILLFFASASGIGGDLSAIAPAIFAIAAAHSFGQLTIRFRSGAT